MRQLINRGIRGFTLIELMVAVAVLAVLLSIGVPSLSTYYANNKLQSSADVVASALSNARTEAIKRNCTVDLKVTGNSLRVEATSGCAKAELLKEVLLPSDVQVSGMSTASFGSTGMVVPFGESVTASLGLSNRSCADGVKCPSVKAEAGGAVNICKTGACS